MVRRGNDTHVVWIWDQVEKERIDEDETLLVGRRNEMLLVWKVAQVKEECRHGYVVL